MALGASLRCLGTVSLFRGLPEIDFNKVDKIRGMNISIVTTARTDEEGRALLQYFGMPFAKN